MTLLTPTDKPIYWGISNGADILLSNVTIIGDATGLNDGWTIKHADDPNEFLGLVSGDVANYNPLPAAGEQVEAGEIYGYGNGLVICRQSHTRTEHDPASVPALFLTYQPGSANLQWIVGEWVNVGDTRFHSDIEYRCIQAHQTVTGQTPDVTPALWEVVATSSEWQAGVAYSAGDVVSYQGVEYICIQSHTAQVGWQPPNVPALWGLV